MGFVAKVADVGKLAVVKSIFPRYNSKMLDVFGPEVGFFNNYNEIEKFANWLGKNVDSVTAVSFRP